jgi:hypothetical protein
MMSDKSVFQSSSDDEEEKDYNFRLDQDEKEMDVEDFQSIDPIVQAPVLKRR